jgi:hypothetical protein
VTDLEREGPLNRVLEHDRPGRSFVAAEGSRWGELILPAAAEARHRSAAGLRVLAVTSFWLGLEALEALLGYERAHPDEVYLVAVATDDPINADAKIGLRKRLWRFFSPADRLAMEVATVEAALCAGVAVYTGELKIDWFRRRLADWRPDAIVVCGCGQIFDGPILDSPRYGVYNLHPSDLAHGHGAGYEPHEDALRRNDPWTCWTLHQMAPAVDAGPIVGQSPRICVADRAGRIERDVSRYYGRMKDALGPMVEGLLAGLVALHARGGDRLGPIDFDARFPAPLKARLAEPIAAS